MKDDIDMLTSLTTHERELYLKGFQTGAETLKKTLEPVIQTRLQYATDSGYVIGYNEGINDRRSH